MYINKFHILTSNIKIEELRGHQVVYNVTLSTMWDYNVFVFGKNKNNFCIQGSLFKPKEDTAKRDAQLGFVDIRMMLDKRLVSNLEFQIGIARNCTKLRGNHRARHVIAHCFTVLWIATRTVKF